MKRITSLLILGLVLLCSCGKVGPEGVNEITDLYTVPADAQVMSAVAAKSTWAGDRRYFDFSFDHDALVTTLVGYDAELAPGQYVLGPDAIGNAILANTKVGGQAVQKGFITVGKKGTDYQITATLDGKVYAWEGSLPFKADPDPVRLSVVLSAQSNVANGVNSLTMSLATPGISSGYDENWQEVWTGEGGYLALDLFSDDGYLHEGTYTPSAEGGVINEGEFGIGWDPGDIYGIGWEFTDWGTCWWDVKDGGKTATKITTGVVTVSREDKVWTIAWGDKRPTEYVFTGEIPALTKPDKPSGPAVLDYLYTEGELQPVTDQSGNLVSGVWKHPISITDKNGTERAYLELLIAEGETNYEGSYPSTSYASQAGQMADGWEFDGTAWGMGFMEGGSYYMTESGEKIRLTAGAYTVEVTKVAEGAYRFTCSLFDFAAAGPDYDPGQGGGGETGDDVSGDVVLKITSGLSYSMEDITAGNTSADGSALSGMTLWRVTVSDGSGTVAAFDLGTDAGKEDISGAYSVMSYPDAPGKAGNGWGFAAWGMFGGCYFIVDGAYYFIPIDATVNVSANADGTLKFKFEGPVQKDDYSDGGQGGVLLDNVAKS